MRSDPGLKHRMRLAIAMRRTLRELEESLGSDEWNLWLAFIAEYDLPDGYLVAGRVGQATAAAAGCETRLSDHAPFYDHAPRVMTPEEMRAKFARAREVVAGTRPP